MVSFNALRTRRNAIFASLGALLVTIFVVVAIYIIRLQLKSKGGKEESDHTLEERNQKESVKPLIEEIKDHLKAYKEGKISEVDCKDLISNPYNEARNKLDAAEDKADKEFLAHSVDEIIKQYKVSKPIPRGTGGAEDKRDDSGGKPEVETEATKREGDLDKSETQRKKEDIADHVTSSTSGEGESEGRRKEVETEPEPTQKQKEEVPGSSEEESEEREKVETEPEPTQKQKEEISDRESSSTSNEKESEEKEVETEPESTKSYELETLEGFFHTYGGFLDCFKGFISQGHDYLQIKLGQFEDVLRNLDPTVPDDQIPLKLKRDSTQQDIKQRLFRYYFFDVAEFFIEFVKRLIIFNKSDKDIGYIESALLRWRELIKDFQYEGLPLDHYSPYLTAKNAQELIAIYDGVKSLNELLPEFARKTLFVLVGFDKIIPITFAEKPTVKNLEKLIDILLDSKHNMLHNKLSIRNLAKNFVSNYFHDQTELKNYLVAKIEFVYKYNKIKKIFEKFKWTKEEQTLVNLLIQDPLQVDFTLGQEVSKFESILYIFGKFLICKYEYYKSDSTQVSDDLELSNLLKRAHHVNYLYRKCRLLRYSSKHGIQLTFENADKLGEAISRSDLVDYFISKFKILRDESPEKKEIADGLQEFSFNALTDLMKTDHNLSGLCNLLEKCVSDPTVDDLSGLCAFKGKLHGKPFREVSIPGHPQVRAYSVEDSSIVRFTKALLKFVEASKVTGRWNALIIDFFEKFSLQLSKESSLPKCMMQFGSFLPMLEEQLDNPSFAGMRELTDTIRDPIFITRKLLEIFLQATLAKVALDKLDPSRPSFAIESFNLIDKLFAPARLFYFADRTPPKTHFFYLRNVIPENELKLIFEILRTSFGEFQLEKCSLAGFLKNLKDILNDIKGVDLRDFEQKLLFIIDEQVPEFRRLMKHFESSVPGK